MKKPFLVILLSLALFFTDKSQAKSKNYSWSQPPICSKYVTSNWHNKDGSIYGYITARACISEVNDKNNGWGLKVVATFTKHGNFKDCYSSIRVEVNSFVINSIDCTNPKQNSYRIVEFKPRYYIFGTYAGISYSPALFVNFAPSSSQIDNKLYIDTNHNNSPIMKMR